MRHNHGQERHRVVLVVLAVLAAAVVVVSLLAWGGDDDQRSASRGDQLLVRTDLGALRGAAEGIVRSWRGIPFAEPPVGELRWRPPQPALSWGGVRDATSDGAACVQPADYAFGDRDRDLTQRTNSSEDCLYLNVTAPASLPKEPQAGSGALPVIVWLHGGGFFEGSGSLIDPSVLASRGVVVVTINYRLGRLGFFAHPSLRSDAANLGLLDQMSALQWVRDNISAFGGDARAVTLMGGSAGAMSVNALMAAPAAAGLFDRAIAESAPGDSAALTLQQARRRGERAFPGASADELRAMPASAFLSSTFNVLTGDAPIVDSVLPQTASDAFAAGRELAVPYLVGSTDGEFSDTDFRSAGVDPVRERAALGGQDHDALVASYGLRDYRDHVLDDLVFAAPAASLALQHSSRAPTYRYRFAADPGGSGHGAEVSYVFGLEERRSRQTLVSAIGAYWLAFARTGTPAAGGLPAWPEARGTAVLLLTAGGPVPLSTDPWTARLRALYATVPLRLPARSSPSS